MVAMELVHNVCAHAPQGVGHYTDLIMSWTKYGVGSVILIMAVASVATLAVGKVARSATAAQFGASALVWVLLAAIAFVLVYGIVAAIVGRGC